MSTLTILLAGELSDFAPGRQQPITIAYPGRASIKDTIEALGVPHPEIFLLMADDSAIDFGYIAPPEQAIQAFPLPLVRAALPGTLLNPPPAPRFVLDVHLGRLAEYLRLLGFDTLYRNDYDDPELAQIAHDEDRILLSRDLGLLKRGQVRYGSYVRATDPRRQIHEIVRRFGFVARIDAFRRCPRCNGLLHPVAKADVVDRLPPITRDQYDTFQMCEACSQIYWPGTPYQRILTFVESVRAGEQPDWAGGADELID